MVVIKYIQHILQYLPKDVECQGWLDDIADISNELPKEKRVGTSEKNNTTVSNGTPDIAPKLIEEIDYNLEESMATFTMLQVLKSQKYYQQALAVLKMLESKNMDAVRITRERDEINSLLIQDRSA